MILEKEKKIERDTTSLGLQDERFSTEMQKYWLLRRRRGEERRENVD